MISLISTDGVLTSPVSRFHLHGPAPGYSHGNTISGLPRPRAHFVRGWHVGHRGGVATSAGNTINTLSGSGATSPVVKGISVSGGTTVNVFKNKIYDLSESGAISTTSPAINGMVFSAGTTVTTFNNLVGDLRAPSASLTDAIRGISVTSDSDDHV